MLPFDVRIKDQEMLIVNSYCVCSLMSCQAFSITMSCSFSCLYSHSVPLTPSLIPFCIWYISELPPPTPFFFHQTTGRWQVIDPLPFSSPLALQVRHQSNAIKASHLPWPPQTTTYYNRAVVFYAQRHKASVSWDQKVKWSRERWRNRREREKLSPVKVYIACTYN